MPKAGVPKEPERSEPRIIWKQLNDALTVLIGGVLTALISVLLSKAHTKPPKQAIEQRIAELSTIQGNLKELSAYIDAQKKSLSETSEVVNRLKEEKAKLENITKADRETVDALLSIQEQRNQSGIWKERIISFLLGVLSSLIAAYVWAFLAKRRIAGAEPV